MFSLLHGHNAITLCLAMILLRCPYLWVLLKKIIRSRLFKSTHSLFTQFSHHRNRKEKLTRENVWKGEEERRRRCFRRRLRRPRAAHEVPQEGFRRRSRLCYHLRSRLLYYYAIARVSLFFFFLFLFCCVLISLFYLLCRFRRTGGLPWGTGKAALWLTFASFTSKMASNCLAGKVGYYSLLSNAFFTLFMCLWIYFSFVCALF